MNQNHKIKAIIFDLGRVLVKVDLARGIFRHIEGFRQKSDVEIMENLFRDGLYQDFAKGKLPPRQFYKALCNHLGFSIDYEEFVREWCEVLEPMPGMNDLVIKLSKSYTIGLLSDLGPIHWEYVSRNLQVLKYIKSPVVSYQTGVLKPEKRAYELAAKSVGQPLSSCLFIDDRKVNVQGAVDAGMQAVQFISVRELTDELREKGIL